MVQVWKHHPEYAEARERVLRQATKEDLATLDALFGRDRLAYGASPDEVKQEALRQVEIEFRSERDEKVEFQLIAAGVR